MQLPVDEAKPINGLDFDMRKIARVVEMIQVAQGCLSTDERQKIHCLSALDPLPLST
jgi:hypothetical protein